MSQQSGMSLVAVDVEFNQGADRVRALQQVDLDIADRSFVTVIGSNGAGKSTLANVIAGCTRPTRGRVVIGERDVTSMPEHQRARLVARVMQDPKTGTAGDLTVGENMALAAARGERRSFLHLGYQRSDRERFTELLAEYGRGLERKIDTPVKQLSGGQRQVVALLMAGASRPDVLLLDEHTSALDPAMAEQVMERTERLIGDLGLTAVMVTHNLTQARQHGDRILIMDAGRVVDDLHGERRQQLTDGALIAAFRRVVQGGVVDEALG